MDLSQGNSIFELFTAINFGFGILRKYLNFNNSSEKSKFLEFLDVTSLGQIRDAMGTMNQSLVAMNHQFTSLTNVLKEKNLHKLMDKLNLSKAVLDAVLSEMIGINSSIEADFNSTVNIVDRYFVRGSYIFGLFGVFLLLITALLFGADHSTDIGHACLVIGDLLTACLLVRYLRSEMVENNVYYQITLLFIIFGIGILTIVPVIVEFLFTVEMSQFFINFGFGKLQDIFYSQSFKDNTISANILLFPLFYVVIFFTFKIKTESIMKRPLSKAACG